MRGSTVMEGNAYVVNLVEGHVHHAARRVPDVPCLAMVGSSHRLPGYPLIYNIDYNRTVREPRKIGMMCAIVLANPGLWRQSKFQTCCGCTLFEPFFCFMREMILCAFIIYSPRSYPMVRSRNDRYLVMPPGIIAVSCQRQSRRFLCEAIMMTLRPTLRVNTLSSFQICGSAVEARFFRRPLRRLTPDLP